MGDCALDLCCGSGDLAFLLFEKVGSNGKVTGLDFSKEQLSIASCRQGLALNACYNNIEWVEGDALELPFSDGYFDAITMGYGLRNVVDKERSMQEMFRVLKPAYLRVTMNITTFALCYSNKWLFSILYFFRTFIGSNNLQLSKNHQLHPIHQAAYKFYVGVR
ncbi:2-phytyl-1,4-beta-naphthoquinone methyltransferase, chloroplastic-like isoform X3 [Quercus robur]|uniref:2-phytyl-1,4-beta-naphthoquinone methyltransferase, chloroplastic-like isoform X3 n=1 Tax=Quercus robur TaxID=38942 RepID=UPI0021622050|nr:2-phytyl-1,4-beta-naphthoquinone methyltransferase, chloroplastic-like isoform X3 [Quercus robur]